jgi:hypothetical protein
MLILKFNLTVLSFFLITGCSNGQEDSMLYLNDAWTKLKVQLHRRNDIAANLISGISKAGFGDSLAIKEVRTELENFTRFCENDRALDSTIVQLTKQKADKSRQLVLKAWKLLPIDDPLNQESFRNLQMQLESAENRIRVAKKDFNDLCSKYNRKDLLFDPKPKPSSAIQQ